ncbi:MAG TPA: hypothetical protein VL689_14420 [Paraburkholderia sp.]|jgi:hypothetical protein|nr:hypothetical protein [Paraburkholderia sp.]
MTDDRVELLLAIAGRALDIDSFEPTGEREADWREVRVEDVGRALEAAYDAGLLVGYRIGRAESLERV